jgi:16S rRNA (guanine(966)-N(2))-methyltransferase RsmD
MRIVAGVLGGRRLVAPRGEATRPTGERVREALFAMLGASVEGARVLDVYAGTGALGLEALSRGADRIVFVESSGAAQQAIRANVTALGVDDRCTLLTTPAERTIPRLTSLGPFDLVLADPPWARVRDAVVLLSTLAGAGVIAAGATVVLEHPAGEEPHVEGLASMRRRAYGDTGLSIYERPAHEG